MSKVLLLQLDGGMPNIALMRLSAHHKNLGHSVELGRDPHATLWDEKFDFVYASVIFEKSRAKAEQVLKIWPHAVIGGTGWDFETNLESRNVGKSQDYSIYPKYRHSIGFTQRGCRLKCPFCVVPKKEGSVSEENSIQKIWRGEPWPREINLLDNDFFGQPHWRDRIAEIRNGDFKVSFSQGINARFLLDETAEAISSVKYYDDNFKTRRIYTAWDNNKDEDRLMRGLSLLLKYGVKPDHIMVYMLIGYWPGETHEDREHRRKRLREFGARPYPMPFIRSQELAGFQRWVIGAYDKRIAWDDWKAARYQPCNLGASA